MKETKPDHAIFENIITNAQHSDTVYTPVMRQSIIFKSIERVITQFGFDFMLLFPHPDEFFPQQNKKTDLAP